MSTVYAVAALDQRMRAGLSRKEIDNIDIADLREIATDIYNAIGPDMGWVEETPRMSEFVSVMRDRMRDELGAKAHKRLLTAWEKLNLSEKHWLLVDVL